MVLKYFLFFIFSEIIFLSIKNEKTLIFIFLTFFKIIGN